jgi:hypothetical protein
VCGCCGFSVCVTYQQDGHTGCVVLDLGPPLALDVLEGVGRDDGEGDEEDVRLGIGQGAETVVVLLASCVPETEVHGLAVDHDVGAVVVEHGGDVLAGEGVGGVRDEEAGLADGTVPYHDALDVLHLTN